MINSVNSVSFKSAVPQYNDPFARPGRFTKPVETPAVKQEKSHKALKWIVGIAATALVAGALLIVGKNKNWFKEGGYLNKAGDFLNKKCWEPMKSIPDKISNWYKNWKGPKEAPAAAPAPAPTPAPASVSA